MRKILVFLSALLFLMGSSLHVFAAKNIQFSDVSEWFWGKPAIDWAIENSITTGYSNGTFKPNKNITEAEFLAFLTRLLPDYEIYSNPTSSHWAEKSYLIADEIGIPTKGQEDLTTRDKPITRENVARMIYGFCGNNALNTPVEDSIQFLLDNHISNGKVSYSVEGYMKDDLLTRAEAVTFIHNLRQCELIDQIESKQSRKIKGYTISTFESKDGKIQVSGSPYHKDVEEIEIMVSNYIDPSLDLDSEKEDWLHLSQFNGAWSKSLTPEPFETELLLPWGEGEYNIWIGEKLVNQDGIRYVTEFIVKNSDTEILAYIAPSKFAQSDHPKIIGLANSITKNKKSDLEKARAIHQWIVTNIRYSDEFWFATSLQVLERRKGVCTGYTTLTNALLKAVNIPARPIGGYARYKNKTWEETIKGMGHAWTEAYIDGEWIIIDTTWNIFNPSREVFEQSHLTDKQLIERGLLEQYNGLYFY